MFVILRIKWCVRADAVPIIQDSRPCVKVQKERRVCLSSDLTPELRSDPLLVKERVRISKMKRRLSASAPFSLLSFLHPLLNKERVGTEFRGEVA